MKQRRRSWRVRYNQSWLRRCRPHGSRIRLVKHRAGTDTCTHTRITAADRGTHTDTRASRDLPILIDANANAQRACAGSNTSRNATGAGTQAN